MRGRQDPQGGQADLIVGVVRFREKSFVTGIVIRDSEATMKYAVPMPLGDSNSLPLGEVRPILPAGGAGAPILSGEPSVFPMPHRDALPD
jgi:hypothetical protein